MLSIEEMMALKEENKKLKQKIKDYNVKEWGDNGYGYISYEYADKFLTDAWAISMESAKAY